MIAVKIIIKGRVQGVGFRDWTAREARARGLVGHVRNRADGAVEAVFGGEDAAVQAMVDACHRGPRSAVVSRITAAQHEVQPWADFTILPTT